MPPGSHLAKRLTWSAFLIALGIYTVFLSPRWLFVAIIEFFLLCGLWEYFSLAERKGYFINRYLGLAFGALLPISFSLSGDVLILTVAVLCIFIFNFHRHLKEQAIIGTALTLFGLIYVGWFFSFIIKIHDLTDGRLWIFYTILVVKSGDACAYFFGKQFGVSKFAAHISPNKSIEGAIAGFLGTVGLSVASKIYLRNISLMELLFLGMLVGVMAQLGDLAESLLKRDAKVKDSGAIPGLGGVLDVLDSLLLTIPIVFYFLSVTREIN